MDMYKLNKMLENQEPVQAPPGFTKEVMKQISAMNQPNRYARYPSLRIKYLQQGISLLCAGLIVLFLNLLPLIEPVERSNLPDWSNKPIMSRSVESFSRTVDSLISHAEDIIVRPWSDLIEMIRKEN